jgi:high-affinity Fe2+/Pb2+ permease
MKRAKLPLTALIIGAAVVFLTGFALAWGVIERPPLSAAATIRCTLAALAVGPLVLGGAGVLLTQWWARRKQRQRYEDAIRQADVYERLQGSSRQPRSRPRRRSSERDREPGDTIRIVLSDRARQR